MPVILVVEDEISIRNVIRTYLESENFRVVCAGDGSEALTLARELAPDLIILDLMLPGIDGMEVTARLRQESDVYILILTARTEEIDRVAGLRIGADDYLTKPFSPRELVARVQAILRRRRSTEPATNTLRFEHLSIDPDRHEVWTAEQLLEMTTTEFKVLLELARHAGRVLTREQLIDLVWGMDFYGTDRVVDVYVGQVRRKLEQATGESVIQSVRGVGYKFVDVRR
ncbi:MAG: response regulator transcription factor [Anaerolineales bacterium]|nr:response regulator transcription factor [Anaerolineales bacterium]